MMGSNPSAPAQVKINAGLYVLAARDIFRLLEAKTRTARAMGEPLQNFQVFPVLDDSSLIPVLTGDGELF